MEFLDNSVIQAGLAVLLVQQILKLKVVPVSFANKYPVQTNIVLSVLASIFILDLDWSFSNAGKIAVNVITVGVVAAIAFNQLIGKSEEVRELEGYKE